MDTIAQHLEMTPDICGGKPRIAGSRITVHNIVIWHERMGQSPDEIVAQFPQLSLADVHAALAYYFDHVAEINEQIDRARQFADEMERNTPSLLKAKLERMNGNADSLPPG